MSRFSRGVVVVLTAGTAAGVAAGLVGARAFRALVGRDVRALLGEEPGPAPARVLTEEMLADLPEPVRRYLHHTGVVGRPFVRTVRATQQGRMRLAPGQPWVPLDARVWYSVRPPGFVWDGTLHLGRLPLARARDQYRGGQGRMLVKAAASLTVVDEEGEEMDQNALMRWLSEMVWFPSAFLEDNVSFEAVDGTSARVTLSDAGRTVSATMVFDATGRVCRVMQRRTHSVDGRAEQRDWSLRITGYDRFDGLNLPVRGMAVDGDFEYVDVTLRELAYDA